VIAFNHGSDGVNHPCACRKRINKSSQLKKKKTPLEKYLMPYSPII
jgi:hypothetical protein